MYVGMVLVAELTEKEEVEVKYLYFILLNESINNYKVNPPIEKS